MSVARYPFSLTVHLKKRITTVSGSCYSFEWRMGNVHNPSMYSKESNYYLQGLFYDVKFRFATQNSSQNREGSLMECKIEKIKFKR